MRRTVNYEPNGMEKELDNTEFLAGEKLGYWKGGVRLEVVKLLLHSNKDAPGVPGPSIWSEKGIVKENRDRGVVEEYMQAFHGSSEGNLRRDTASRKYQSINRQL